jgi:hypothetical protein
MLPSPPIDSVLSAAKSEALDQTAQRLAGLDRAKMAWERKSSTVQVS